MSDPRCPDCGTGLTSHKRKRGSGSWLWCWKCERAMTRGEQRDIARAIPNPPENDYLESLVVDHAARNDEPKGTT